MGNNLCKDNINNLQFCPSKMNKKDEKYWNKYILETCTPMDPKETLRISHPQLRQQSQNNTEDMPIAPPRKKRTKLTLKNNQSDLIIKNGFKDVFYNENNIIHENNNYNNNINTTNNNNYKHFYNSLSPNSKEKLKTINIGNRKSDKFFGENLYDSLANEPIEKPASPTSPTVLLSSQIIYTSKTLNTETPVSGNKPENKVNNNYQLAKQTNSSVEGEAAAAQTDSIKITEEIPAVVSSENDNKNILLHQKSKFLLTMLSDHDSNLSDINETISYNEIPKKTPRKNKARKINNNNNKSPEKPQRTFSTLNNNDNNNTKKQIQRTLTRNVSMPHTNLYFHQYNTNNNNNVNNTNNNNININHNDNNTDNDNENKEKIVNFLKKCKSSNSFLTEIIMDDMIRKVYDFNINSDYWLNDNHTYCDDGICDGSTVFIPKTVNYKKSDEKPKFSIGNAEIIKNKEEMPINDKKINDQIEVEKSNLKDLDKITLKDSEISQSAIISKPISYSDDELIKKETKKEVKFIGTEVLEVEQAEPNFMSLLEDSNKESRQPADLTKDEYNLELTDKEENKIGEVSQSSQSSLPTEKMEGSEKGPIGYEIECQQPVIYKIEPHIRKVSVTCSLPSISEDESKSNEDLRDIDQDEISTISSSPESPECKGFDCHFEKFPEMTENLIKSSESETFEAKCVLEAASSKCITNETKLSVDSLEKSPNDENTITDDENPYDDTDNKLSSIIQTYALDDIYKNKNNILNEFQSFLKGEIVMEKCDRNTEIAKSIDEVLAELDVDTLKPNPIPEKNDDENVKEIISNDFIFVEIPKHKSKEIIQEITETRLENDDKVKIIELIEKTPKKPNRKRSQSVSDYRSDSIEDLDLWFSKHTDSPFENKSLKSVIHGSRMGRRGSDGNCGYDTRKLFPFGTRVTQERTLLESVEFFTTKNDIENLSNAEPNNEKIEQHSTLLKYLK